MNMRNLINLVEQKLFEYEDTIDVLKKYAHDPDVFVHFSNVPKFGFFPRQMYAGTPFGYFGFPLNIYWNDIQKYGFESGGMIFGDRKYVIVFRCISDNVVEMANYTDEDLKRDYGKLRTIYAEMGGIRLAQALGALNPKEEQQISNDRFKKAFAKGLVKAKKMGVSDPIYKLWYGTEIISDELVSHSALKHHFWTKLFKRCGYDGFVDRGNERPVIHRSENHQGMFFTPRAIKLIEILPNVQKR